MGVDEMGVNPNFLIVGLEEWKSQSHVATFPEAVAGFM